MTTPVYIVNSTEFYGVNASWQQVVKRKNSDGSIVYQPYALHTWEISQAEMDSFLALNLIQGQALTSLQTVDITDAAAGATYTSAELTDIVNITQTGRRATGLRVVFRVGVE
jgi:hypothetical protein